MEVVVFADTPTKALGDSLLATLERWEGPVTVLCPHEAIADSFRTNRTKPFTRCVVNERWTSTPLPPMTASVESNILSVLTWQHEQQARKMLAFQSVAAAPQSSIQLFLLASRGLVNTEATQVFQRFQRQSSVVLLTANQSPAMLIVPEQHGSWLFEAWMQRNTQASQEMLDALLDQPLTLDAFHKDVASAHSLATFQWLARTFPNRLEIVDANLGPGEFAASALASVSAPLAAVDISVNDVTGNGTAWVFFALVAAAIVLGIGVAVGGIRAAKQTPSALETRWQYLSKLP